MNKKSRPSPKMRKITINMMLVLFMLSLLLPGLDAFAAGSKTAYLVPEEELLELIVKYDDGVDIDEIKATVEEQQLEISNLTGPLDGAINELTDEPAKLNSGTDEGQRTDLESLQGPDLDDSLTEQNPELFTEYGDRSANKPTGKRFQQSADILSEIIEQDGVELEAVNDDGIVLISFEDADSMQQSMEELAGDPNVLYAEPNHLVYAFGLELSDLQWGPEKIMASSAWARVDTESEAVVTVAVIDTGVDATHPDLQGVVVDGYNFIEKDSKGKAYSANDFSDDNGHGTHVSGIISAVYNNGVGIMGVSGPANVRIIPLKVLNDDGKGTALNVSSAIKYAADQGADVLNLSLGSSYTSQTESDAIVYAQNKGCLIVAAAGNESTNVAYSYPASYPGVIAVGAIDQINARAYFSNYGDRLDVVAPGVDVLSTVPKDIAIVDMNQGYAVYGDADSGYYEMMSGTSMASPHVAGLAALYKAIYPNASRMDMSEKIINTASDLGTPGKDTYYGNGLVNADAAVGGVVISRYVAITSPQNNSEIYGQANFRFEINTSKGIEKVDLYVDAPNIEDNLIATVPCVTGNSIYTCSWDTSLVADGSHVIYAVAKGADLPDDAMETVSVRVANTLENGFVLVVRDPVDNASVSGAAVTLWGKSSSGSYTRVADASSDENGNVRLRDTAGGKTAYLVTASGSHKAFSGNTGYFYYRKDFTAADLGSKGDIGKSEQTRELDITLIGENGPLSTPVLAIAPEVGGQVRSVLNPWQPSESVRYFVDDGKYDFYSYWSPSVAGAPANEATYFLSKAGVNISAESTTSVAFNYGDGAKITADYHHPQASGVFFLEGVKSDTSFGIPFADNSVSSLAVYVSPGEYNTYALIDIPSDEGVWQYRLKKNDSVTVAQGTASQTLDFGGSIVIGQFEPSRQVMGTEEEGYYLYRGDIFTTNNSITDTYGNEISYVSGQAAALMDENALFFVGRQGEDGQPEIFKMTRDEQLSPIETAYATTVWPEFTVNRLDEGTVGELVHNERSSFQYSSSYWTGKDSNNVLQPPGFFRATLSYDGGPLGGIATKTVDFEIRELVGERVDVTLIKDKKEFDRGASYKVVAPYGTVDLYTWDGYGEADSWTKVNDRPYQADGEGVLYIPVDVASRLGSVNVALAQHTSLKTGYSNASSSYGYKVMPFKSLSELKFIDFIDTVPVSVRVFDNYGNRKSVPLAVGVVSDGGGALSRPQFVGEARVTTGTSDGTYGNSTVYMTPGQCAYMYSGFTSNYASLYLHAPEMNIMSGLIVVLDGRKAVRMSVDAYGDLKDGSVLQPHGVGAEKSLFSGHDLRYFNDSFYWLPGIYSPVATINNGTYSLQMESAGAPLSINGDTALRFGMPRTVELKVVSSAPIANRVVSVDVNITDDYGNRLLSASPQVQAIVTLNDGQTERVLTGQEDDNPFHLIRFTPDKDGQYTLKYELDINGEKITQTIGLTVGENVLNNLMPVAGGKLASEIISSNEVLFTVPADVEGFQNVDISVQHPAGLDGVPSVKFTHYRGERLQSFIRLTGDFSVNSYPRAGFNLNPGDTVKVELVLP